MHVCVRRKLMLDVILDPSLFSETVSLSEHGDLTGVVSHFAPRILCLAHLSTKVTGPLSSLPIVHVCTGDLTSGLLLAGQALYPLSPLPASPSFLFWALLGSKKTLGNRHGLGLTCYYNWGTRSCSLSLVTHSRFREPRLIRSTGSHYQLMYQAHCRILCLGRHLC